MKKFLAMAGFALLLFALPFLVGTLCASAYHWTFYHPGLWEPAHRAMAMAMSFVLLMTIGMSEAL